MRGHWSSQTRKLNRHYQSDSGPSDKINFMTVWGLRPALSNSAMFYSQNYNTALPVFTAVNASGFPGGIQNIAQINGVIAPGYDQSLVPGYSTLSPLAEGGVIDFAHPFRISGRRYNNTYVFDANIDDQTSSPYIPGPNSNINTPRFTTTYGQLQSKDIGDYVKVFLPQEVSILDMDYAQNADGLIKYSRRYATTTVKLSSKYTDMLLLLAGSSGMYNGVIRITRPNLTLPITILREREGYGYTTQSLYQMNQQHIYEIKFPNVTFDLSTDDHTQCYAGIEMFEYNGEIYFKTRPNIYDAATNVKIPDANHEWDFNMLAYPGWLIPEVDVVNTHDCFSLNSDIYLSPWNNFFVQATYYNVGYNIERVTDVEFYQKAQTI